MLDKNGLLEKLPLAAAGRNVFYGALISSVDFQSHTFEGPVNLSGAIFTGDVDFSGAVFKHYATFDSAVFHKPAYFRACRFERAVQLSLASFDEFDFFQTRVYGAARFWRTFFRAKADFSQIKVSKADWLPPDFDGQANFSWARFCDNATFTDAEFDWPVYLHRTLFKGAVYFDQCTFRDVLYLNGKENDVLFPRFGVIDPAIVGTLETQGICRPDTERHIEYQKKRVSEFVCFNNILSDADLIEKLERVPDAISRHAINAIRSEWQQGAQKLFADNRLVSFRLEERFLTISKSLSASTLTWIVS